MCMSEKVQGGIIAFSSLMEQTILFTYQFAMKKCGFGSGHYIFIQSLLNLIFSQMLQFLHPGVEI